MLIDDVGRDDLVSTLGTTWRAVSDRVMDGISRAGVEVEEHDGHRCLRLRGEVRLENGGGFVQMALDLGPSGGCLDARAFTGIRLVVQGEPERYSLHLRTPDASRPWQSYRAGFRAERRWRELRLPFTAFTPYRIELPLDVSRLRRVGLVAIGRRFAADLRLAEIGLYR